jgi:hypothetical protein
MTNRPARITQSEIDRLIRAGKKAGLGEVRIKIGNEAWVSFPLTATVPVDHYTSGLPGSSDSRWGD